VKSRRAAPGDYNLRSARTSVYWSWANIDDDVLQRCRLAEKRVNGDTRRHTSRRIVEINNEDSRDLAIHRDYRPPRRGSNGQTAADAQRACTASSRVPKDLVGEIAARAADETVKETDLLVISPAE